MCKFKRHECHGIQSGGFWPFNYFNPPIPHPAHQHCQSPVNQAVCTDSECRFPFHAFRCSKNFRTVLAAWGCSLRFRLYEFNGIGNLSHTTTHSFRNQGHESRKVVDEEEAEDDKNANKSPVIRDFLKKI